MTNAERAAKLRQIGALAAIVHDEWISTACYLSAMTLDVMPDDPFEDPRREEARQTLLKDIRQRFEDHFHAMNKTERVARDAASAASQALEILRPSGL